MKKLSRFKRITLIALLIIAFAFACITVPFINPIEVEGRLIPYNYTIHGTYVSIDRYTGGSHDVEIPSYIWFRPVKEIQVDAFEESYYLESVTIPDTVETMTESFYMCVHLKNVSIGKRVKELGGAQFLGCWELEEIVIPENVERLEKDTFNGCVALESVTFYNSDVEIKEGAFRNCNFDILTLMAEKGSTIEAYAKEYGIKFEELDMTLVQDLPKDVAEGGKEGDYTYKVLEDGTVCLLKYFGKEEVIVVPSEIAGKKVTMTLATFRDNRDVREVTIPDTIIHIGDATFENALSLEKVYGGQSVESIDWNAFAGCTWLIELPEFSNLKEIGILAFVDCRKLEYIHWGEKLKKVGYHSFWLCDELKSVELPEGLEEIEAGAFDNCFDIDKLEIPTSVTYIGDGAFPYEIKEDGSTIGEGFQLVVEEGSYAETYAIENKIPYEIK